MLAAAPATMKELWDYQLQAALAVARGRLRLLAWEPGTGKTGVALNAGLGPLPHLYVCPASIRRQVEAEAHAFLGEDHRVQVITARADKVDPAARLVIVSYDMIVWPALFRQLVRREWQQITLDEAHYLKNREAKRTKAIYGARTNSPGALFRRARRTLAMTGTPVLNNPADLWTHYSRLFPEALLDDDTMLPLKFQQWIDRFCILQDRGFGPVIVGGRNLDELREVLAPFMSRRTREGLPPLSIFHVPVEGRQLDFSGLDDEERAYLFSVLPDIEADRDVIDPALETARVIIANAKAKAVADYVLDTLGSSKVLLFGIHREALQAMWKHLSAALAPSQSATLVMGGMSNGAREQAIGRFLTDHSCRVLVAQLHAAGTGLNLQAADRVVFAEAAWTPAINEQAIARAHRAGQTNPVMVEFMGLHGTIDDRVTAALARKSRIINRIL